MNVLRSTTARARKQHRCMLCSMSIEPDTLYFFGTCKGDDGLYNTHEHIACATLASLMIGNGPYRDDFPGREDPDTYDEESVLFMLGEADAEHVRAALSDLDPAEQHRGRCFYAAVGAWKAGGVAWKDAWAMAEQAEAKLQAEQSAGAQAAKK